MNSIVKSFPPEPQTYLFVTDAHVLEKLDFIIKEVQKGEAADKAEECKSEKEKKGCHDAKGNAMRSQETPYQGIRLLVDRSGMSLISPTPVRLVPSAGPSICDDIAMDAQVSPTPFFVTTSWKRF